VKQKPFFITFEGCEGSGKSTQSRLLLEWLQDNNIDAILTREPGGTKTAEVIRSLLLDSTIKLEMYSQLLLHYVSRIEHVHDVIVPALAQNKVVICDRYVDSTIAYQHYGYGIDMDLIDNLHKKFLDNLLPDLTFVLDIEFSEFEKRMLKKHNSKDRYEQLPDAFHQKVLRGFRSVAAQNPSRCKIITSSHTIRDVHSTITNLTSSSLT